MEEKDRLNTIDDDSNLPFVSVIMLNYNAKVFIEKSLKSVLGSDYPKYEVIFVDNNSTDCSVEYVKGEFSNDSRLKIVVLDRNYGFAEGNNIALKYVDTQTRYIGFLNSDTEVDPLWLKELVKVMESDLTIGLAQSLILDYRMREIVQCAGICMMDFCGWTWALFRNRPLKDCKRHLMTPINIFAALGTAMIIRKSLIHEIGLFDSDFFFLVEDVDLSWRVRLRGYRILLVPQSIVWHYLGASFESKMTSKTVFIERHRSKNVIMMLIKNYDIWHLLSYLPIALALMFLRATFYTIEGDGTPLTGLVRGIYWNIVHLRKIINKRRYVQRILRKIPDKSLKQVMIRLPLSQIFSRLR